MFLGLIFIFFGIYFLLKRFFYKKKNSYISKHERKLEDDFEYENYLDWCKEKGEIPLEKVGFDEIRANEWKMYGKLKKYGIEKRII